MPTIQQILLQTRGRHFVGSTFWSKADAIMTDTSPYTELFDGIPKEGIVNNHRVGYFPMEMGLPITLTDNLNQPLRIISLRRYEDNTTVLIVGGDNNNFFDCRLVLVDEYVRALLRWWQERGKWP